MLDFIREHGILGSLFRVIGLVWRYLFRIFLVGAVLRAVWLVLFGERSRRRKRDQSDGESAGGSSD